MTTRTESSFQNMGHAEKLNAAGLVFRGKRIVLRDLRWEKPITLMGDNLVASSQFGAYSYLNQFSIALQATVGRYTSLANHCRIGLEKHPTDWVSTHCFPYFNLFPGQTPYRPPERFDWLGQTRIANDVWVGSHCVVMPDVTIGNGAIVGAASVVTSDIPPYAVAVGTPARVVRLRFAEELCQDLSDSAWWDYDWPAALASGLTPPLKDPRAFLSWLSDTREGLVKFKLNPQMAELRGSLEVP